MSGKKVKLGRVISIAARRDEQEFVRRVGGLMEQRAATRRVASRSRRSAAAWAGLVVIVAIAIALLFSSCAELRSGWVKVDFVEGRIPHVGVCVFEQVKTDVNPANDEVTGVCRSLEGTRRALEQREQERHQAPQRSDEL